MSTDWVVYWQWDHIEGWSAEGLRCAYAGSKFFYSEPRVGIARSGMWRVNSGDVIWVVSIPNPQPNALHIRGRFEVGTRTKDPAEVKRLIGREPRWRAAYYVVARDGRGLPYQDINLGTATCSLRFQTEQGITNTNCRDGGVKGNDFQSLRRLTLESASIFQQLWDLHTAAP